MFIELKELVPLILAIVVGFVSLAQSWKKQEARSLIITSGVILALVLFYLDVVVFLTGSPMHWAISYQLLAIICGFGLAMLYSWLTSHATSPTTKTSSEPEHRVHLQPAAGND